MKKITIEVEVEHEKDETVFFMSFKGLPRKAKVVGYFINTLENEIDYFVRNSKEIIVSYPFKANELFKTYDDMMKKNFTKFYSNFLITSKNTTIVRQKGCLKEWRSLKMKFFNQFY